jgi:quercetin dioxygenase-like cupin family protein
MRQRRSAWTAQHLSPNSNATVTRSSSARWPNHVNPDHVHEFDARVMVLTGEITITRDGMPIIYRAGDSCAVPRGHPHAERAGPEGVCYIAGRRMPA